MENQITNSEKSIIIKKIIKRLQKINKKFGNDDAHRMSDRLLCDLLIKLGYKEVVDEYDKSHKWYA